MVSMYQGKLSAILKGVWLFLLVSVLAGFRDSD